VICPWRFLGKRRLEHALHQLGLRETTSVEWLPFELNPDMPAEGIERSVYRTRKFGAELCRLPGNTRLSLIISLLSQIRLPLPISGRPTICDSQVLLVCPDAGQRQVMP
jgi:hypothetical protein